MPEELELSQGEAAKLHASQVELKNCTQEGELLAMAAVQRSGDLDSKNWPVYLSVYLPIKSNPIQSSLIQSHLV